MNKRFALKVLLFVAVYIIFFTAIVLYLKYQVAMNATGYSTDLELDTLVEWTFRLFGIEVGVLMLKRIAEKVVSGIKPQAPAAHEDVPEKDDIAG